MREKLRIKDSFGDERIQVGQLFDITIWAAEFIPVFGQYGRDGKVHIWVYNEDNDTFRMSRMTIRAFKERAGFSYCDFVISDIYEPSMSLGELKSEYSKAYENRREMKRKRRQLI